ncbi:helix-turn-helix domain-containing protein [Actinophytocola oryzae]|uniref:helix-turn-helix domain-containing protein n=1 Tax=Actinophytocola oryzae TaxID=502181 RepID=UPI0014152FF7|nr:helix-turn-helix domain-containing protein [Actinophytocola oryzae]
MLSAPGLASLTLLAGDPARDVRSVRVVAEQRTLRELTSGELAVVLPTVFLDAQGHQFDVALRDTAATGAAAVVLTGVEAEAVEPTARRIADRHALALLTAPPGTEPTQLVIAVARLLGGDASIALARVDDARQRIASSDSPSAILAATAQTLATEVTVRAPDHGEPAALVEVDGLADGYVTATVPARASGAWVIAARAVVRLAADAYARALAEHRRTDLAPIHDRGRLLGELLLAPESERAPLVARARTLGVAVDGWHQVLRFELSSSLAETAGREQATTAQLDAVGDTALDAVRAGGTAEDGWHGTRIGGDVLLVRTTSTNPGQAAARTAYQAATAALDAARERFPGLVVRCGIGGAHRRAAGLRTSATDARAALAATRQSMPPREIVAIDALGLNPMLVEWYASDTTRASVDDLLAPLAELGHQAAEDAIRTLQSYLDHQSSPAKAAKDLNVHPQTITYRLRKITTLLHVDFNDPEQRLALQLACRAWLMR